MKNERELEKIINYFGNLHSRDKKKWTLSFSLKIKIMILLLIFGAIVACSYSHKKELSYNQKLYERYFRVMQMSLTERGLLKDESNLRKYYYAISCCQDNKFAEATLIFEELLKIDLPFKESCMWHLAGCYIMTNQSDDKIYGLLDKVLKRNGRYSILAREVIDMRKK